MRLGVTSNDFNEIIKLKDLKIKQNLWENIVEPVFIMPGNRKTGFDILFRFARIW